MLRSGHALPPRGARAFLAQTDRRRTRRPTASSSRDGGFPESLHRALYAVPLVACVWSSGSDEAMGYPARYLFRFLDHHGMLSVGGSPAVAHGRRRLAHLRRRARRAAARRARRRRRSPRCCGTPTASSVRDAAGPASSTLRPRRRRRRTPTTRSASSPTPTPAEKEVLGAFGYSQNETVLHRDGSLLPRPASARRVVELPDASAPTRRRARSSRYWMNRLQGLPRRRAVLRHAQRRPTGSTPPSVVATMHLRAPDLRPATPSRAAAPAARARPPSGTAFAGALPRAGASTRTAAARRRGRRSLRGAPGERRSLDLPAAAGPRRRAGRTTRATARCSHAFTAPALPVARRPRRPAAAARWLRPFAQFRRRGPPRRRPGIGGGLKANVAAVPAPRAASTLGDRRPGAHARARPGARAHLRPADRLLVLRRRRHPARGASSRCTTPTASRHAYVLAPRRRRPGRPSTRTSTSRRSTTSRAATPSASTSTPQRVARGHPTRSSTASRW